MPALKNSPAGTAPSVLLIEEYDALAAAITSALKKFAPAHRVRAVDSLIEAEASLEESTPRLLIIDIDPPRPDAIDFFERIRTGNPDVRLLAIASGVPSDLNAARRGANAIYFVEKPFELAEFGAAVQALLGPWTKVGSGSSRGSLRNLSARDLVPLQCLNLATAVLHLRQEDRVGEIHFVEGQITHAATDNLTGAPALTRMLGWRNPRARQGERVADAPRTIHGAWATIVLDALQHADVAAEEEPAPVPPAPVVPQATEPAKPPKPSKPAIKSGKKIVIIDDTEMLLIFVEDVLATADPNLQIATAFTGSEGLRRAEVTVPDLVLLDYSLPDLRGDQVCERLLRNEATARIPVVMMSGHVSEMAAAARKYRNVVATIEKPFVSEALVTLIKQTLAKGPLPPERAAAGNGEKPAKKNGARLPAPPEKPQAPAVIAPSPLPPQPVAPRPPAATPPPAPVPPAVEVVASLPVAPSPHLAATNGSTVVVGLGMEVLAVQFTQQFRIGVIRARPTLSTLSLTHSSAPGENLLAGFEIGPVELDPHGRIHTMRVQPTRRPPPPVEVRSRLDINEVALVNQNAAIQVTAGPAAPMRMELLAPFKVAGVELSDSFEVAQLVLQSAGGRVRVNLDPHSRAGATEFETAGVRLDASKRIAEFLFRAV